MMQPAAEEMMESADPLGTCMVPIPLDIVELQKRAEYTNAAASILLDEDLGGSFNKRRKRRDDADDEPDGDLASSPRRRYPLSPRSDRSDASELKRYHARHRRRAHAEDNEEGEEQEEDIPRLGALPQQQQHKEYTVRELKAMCPSSCTMCLLYGIGDASLHDELNTIERWITQQINNKTIDQLAVESYKYWEEIVRPKTYPDPGELPLGDIRSHFLTCRAGSKINIMTRLRQVSTVADSAANLIHVKNPEDGTIKLDTGAVDVLMKTVALEHRLLNQIFKLR